jgi:hypothetical protein
MIRVRLAAAICFLAVTASSTFAQGEPGGGGGTPPGPTDPSTSLHRILGYRNAGGPSELICEARETGPLHTNCSSLGMAADLRSWSDRGASRLQTWFGGSGFGGARYEINTEAQVTLRSVMRLDLTAIAAGVTVLPTVLTHLSGSVNANKSGTGSSFATVGYTASISGRGALFGQVHNPFTNQCTFIFPRMICTDRWGTGASGSGLAMVENTVGVNENRASYLSVQSGVLNEFDIFSELVSWGSAGGGSTPLDVWSAHATTNFQNTAGIFDVILQGWDVEGNEVYIDPSVVTFEDGGIIPDDLPFVPDLQGPGQGPGGGEATATPEPVTMTLLGTGLAGIAAARRRRKTAH